jgi:hypothetical protein
MADKQNPSNAALAQMLINDADAITNPAAHNMEGRMRLAAERLRAVAEPAGEADALIKALRQIKYNTHDMATEDALVRVLGEFVD